MSTPRKLGVFFCLLGFVAVCVLALTLNTGLSGVNGLPGIQSNLASEADQVLRDQAPQAEITVEGRELTVELPDIVNPSYNRAELIEQLEAIDGVRSVSLVGDPMISGEPADAAPTEPTVEPTAGPAAEPTQEPEPPAEPEATPEPAPEPTEEPASTEPTLDEIVSGLDLSAVNFEPGTSRFTAEDTAVLDGIADALQGLANGPVQVQAHTDNVGDPDVNLLLSQDRADAVVAYLIDRGVDASLLTSRGFGAQVPIADNDTEQGRAANQRVVLVVEGN